MTPGTIDTRRAAVFAGLSRGWIETRHMLTDTASMIGNFMLPVIYVIVLLIMGDTRLPGTDFALGTMVLPSLVGMSIALGGLTGPAATIAIDREDGTLLRAKATPNGMLGYLLGKIVLFGSTAFFSVVLLVIPAVMVASELELGPRTWMMLTLLFVVGMLATVPISVALGSLLKSSAQSALLVLASVLLIVPSGIFYPITALPTWLQWVGQAFPFYWLGLGARSAMLPEAMAAVEIAGSWRTLEMFVVLGLWTLIGMALAPRLLSRMARRQSGASVAEARQRVMSKGY